MKTKMASKEDWRSTTFRQKVRSQIQEAVKRSGNPFLSLPPSEMESKVYTKAKTKVEYLSYIARLLVKIRDMTPTAPGQQQPQAANVTLQAGNKQQTVGTTGAPSTSQQLPSGSTSQALVPQPQQVCYDRSGLTQRQILDQHVQHLLQQQQVPQHQLQTQNSLMQQPLCVASQNQVGHNQVIQSEAQCTPIPGSTASSTLTAPPAPMTASTSVPAQTSSTAQHSTDASKATVNQAPAPFVPPPATSINPSPSCQVNVVHLEQEKKLLNFFCHLIRLSYEQESPVVGKAVEELVQDVMEGKLSEEQFVANLQTTLNAPVPQPKLVTFLKKSIPLLPEQQRCLRHQINAWRRVSLTTSAGAVTGSQAGTSSQNVVMAPDALPGTKMHMVGPSTRSLSGTTTASAATADKVKPKGFTGISSSEVDTTSMADLNLRRKREANSTVVHVAAIGPGKKRKLSKVLEGGSPQASKAGTSTASTP